ncbi:recombination protein NinB [Leclercia sp.]|uniref:recombination protein NinB n=1 Tax=Leclercia sp. TaxID=1898428 RepID=UPI0028A83CF0|nr:recombination protein NinB [Leclercia sp.]
MSKIKFQLINNQVKQNTIDYIRELAVDEKRPLIVEVKPKTRSLDQNAKLHSIFSDFAKSGLEFGGKARYADEWKVILISGHSIATGGQGEVIAGIEGELICIRESSAGMSVERMASLIEYVTAYATEMGLQLRDVTYDQYYGVEK